MKELLMRIKKGEKQLYLNVIENYLSLVYLSAKQGMSEEQALEVSITIFTKLFYKINKYKFWQNPANFVSSSLESYASKHNIILESKYSNANQQIPDLLLRRVLINISSSEKRKKRRSFILAIPTFLIIFTLIITFMLNGHSDMSLYPMGTIIDSNSPTSVVYDQNYLFLEGFRSIRQFIYMEPINNDCILIKAFDNDGNPYFDIFNKNARTNTFRIEDNKTFLTSGTDKTLIFYDYKSLFRYDYNGQLLDELNLSDTHQFSDNNKYVLDRKNNISTVYDISNFNILEEHSEEVSILTETGQTISKNEFFAYGYDAFLNNDNYKTAKLIEDDFLTIDETGTYTMYRYGEEIFTGELQYYSHTKSMNLPDESNKQVISVNYNDDYIIIIIEGNIFSAFEIIKRSNGEALVDIRDTIFNGKYTPKPTLNADKSMILFSNLRLDVRNSFNYTTVYDLSKTPIEAYEIKEPYQVKQMLIVGSENNYYVYTLNERYIFKVHEIIQ